MLKGIISLLLIFSVGFALSQSVNGWIVPDQYYYKIGIAEDGMYRITISDLAASGVPVSSFSADNLQLYHKGKEIPIHMVTSSGALNYFEFYGEKNTGWFDLEMFTHPEDQTNPFYSQITDTAAYFLTWNNLGNNLRYQTTPFNSDGDSVEYAFAESITQYTARFFSDEFPEYGKSKGWFDNQTISLGSTRNKTLSLPSLHNIDETIQLKTAVISYGSASAVGANHHLEITLPDGQVFDTLFTGKTSVIKEHTINTQQLNATNTVSFRSIDDLGVSADNMSIAYMHTIYPSDIELTPVQSRIFKMGKSTSNQIITINGLTENEPPTIYDTANHLKPTAFFDGQNWKFSIPASTEDHFIVISHPKSSPAYIKRAKTQLPSLDSRYIIITHPNLISSASNYAAYRNGQVISTDVLYNHFSFGIEKHPLAIRHFLRYYLTNQETYPEQMLLLGKSIDINSSRKNVANHSRNLVPTMGYPPADNLIAAKLENVDDYKPLVAISRISAQTNEQVNNYLNKVQSYENEAPALWMKYFMHFGGGINSYEQTTFESYLRNYENIIEDTLMGAHVATFLKRTSDPIQITTSDSIRNMINNGATMLTFFGHGYAGGFDQDIDEPGAYTNSRLPMIVANSCYSGNIHTTSTGSASEKWVLIPNKGAIAFLASVSEGYTSLLNKFSTSFYQNLAYKNYGASLGEVLKNTTTEHIANATSQLDLGTALTFTLHGDPKVVLNAFDQPDIVLTNTQIQTIPCEVSTAIDSFAIKFIASNYGRTISTNIGYSIEQTLPDGTDTTYVVNRPKLYFNDTITVYIPINRISGIGLNQFRIVADYLNTHDELNETNNSASITVNVKSTALFPIFPYPYHAYNTDLIKLKASTGDPFIENVTALFELDTTPQFNSPFKKAIEQNFAGGVVEWNTELISNPNQTYYWKTGTKNTAEPINWQYNSFTTTPEKNGWTQQSNDQISENQFNFIEFKNGNFDFVDVPRQLVCHNIGSPSVYQAGQIHYKINENITVGACEFHNSMVVVAIDSATFLPWAANHGNYGQYNYPQCASFNYPHALFVFLTNTTESLDDMMNFITYIIPDGFYILTYSFRSGLFETWKERHFEAFENLGAQVIRGVPNAYPYIFFTQKGKISLAQEIVGTSATDIIELTTTLKDNFDYGNMTTPWIGPSRAWNKLHWQFDPSTMQPSDSVKISIISKNAPGKSEHILETNIPISASPLDISHIDSKEHAHLKIDFYTRDKTTKTPAIPTSISCEYEPQSEVAISPSDFFLFPKDSVQEGEPTSLGLAFKNVSNIQSQQKEITYRVTDTYNRPIVSIKQEIPAIEPGSFFIDSINFPTFGLRGHHTLWIEYDQTGVYDFFSFNNLGSIPFFVFEDNINPLLDVTFDGRHIMNGDIISSTPTIFITLNDENPYLSLNDTALFAIYMTNLSNGIEKRVHLQPGIENGTILWNPAQNKKEASITYMPFFEQSGLYELRVQARDISNNLSGNSDYRIQFEVVNESSITNIFNYPNPFSTSTRFVFTLTGNQIPDEINISIYTISGKLVKIISRDELGPIFIGNNVTTYAWNGKDDFGDQLANGVYLYRVNIRIDGQNVKLRKTDADGFFERGWGKMYLLR